MSGTNQLVTTTTAGAVAAVVAFAHARVPLMLWGAPGIGKSDAVRQAAALLGMAVIDPQPATMDPVDMRGLPTLDQGRTTWAWPCWLPQGDARAILLLDDAADMPKALQTACYELTLYRRLGGGSAVGGYDLPEGVAVIATGNRVQDGAGAGRQSTALSNRMGHIEVKADVAEVAAFMLAAATGDVPPCSEVGAPVPMPLAPAIVASFLRYRPALMHVMPEAGGCPAFPTPRSWARVAQMLRVGVSPAARDMVAGALVGMGPASELMAFIRDRAELDPMAALADPKKHPVPAEPSAAIAMCEAIAMLMTPETSDAGFTYLARFSPELTVAQVKAALGREKARAERAGKGPGGYVSVGDCEGFRQWSKRHQAILKS